MSIERTPCIAIVLDGDLVQDVVIQDWPKGALLPEAVVINHQVGHADDDPRVLTIGDQRLEVSCHTEPVIVYERAPARTLEPRRVFDEVVRIERSDKVALVLTMVDEMQSSLREIEQQLVDNNRFEPLSTPYRQLHARLEHWLPILRKQLAQL